MTIDVRALIEREFARYPHPNIKRLLEVGHVGKSQARPADVKKMAFKECFENARKLAKKTGLRYVEGLAAWSNADFNAKYLASPDTCGFIFMEHAWCEDEHGNVVDPTWDDSEHSLYFGA